MAAEHQHPTIELGELMRQYQLGLVFIAGTDATAPARPVQWVHVSELEDPTPFLTPRTVILTTGARFPDMPTTDDADAYVRRMIAAGVSALGIAIGLHWDRVPDRFVAACDRFGLPLFRVPFDTPFIAIVQTAARLLEAHDRERDAWALESQRSLANASLHRDGLSAALREAARRLGRWACVTDRAGRIVEFAPRSARAALVEPIRREAARLIERGARSGRIDSAAGGMRLQALGRRGAALGVLVVQDEGAPDHAERSFLGLLGALATVQLEHRAGLDTAQVALREAIVELLVGGHPDLAARIGHGTLNRFPQGSLIVARHPQTGEPGAPPDRDLDEDLRSLDASTPGLFRASCSSGPLIVAEARHAASLRRFFAAHQLPAGLSTRADHHEASRLVDEAERALAHAITTQAEGPIDYAPALHEGVLHLLDERPEALRAAQHLLAPVRSHDQRHGDTVEASLRAWLSHHGQTSAAAGKLGVHRHTLSARIRTAAELLQVDIDSPDARAEIWTALRVTGRTRG